MRPPLALRHCKSALVANYQVLAKWSGTVAGAAIKADAYGLGAADVARILLAEGCRDFFVSSWWEAAKLDLPPETLAVLHGLGPDDELRPGVRPVLVSAEQVARWKNSAWANQPCDVMVDTGMNRLGVEMGELALLSDLRVHTLHSHLACADEEHALNRLQLQRFSSVRETVTAVRYSLANSAGIFLGREYGFDLVRPGLALYGGIPCPAARGVIRQVCTPRAQVIQLRHVPRGESIGYNATFIAPRDLRAAVINIGYADGYRRTFSTLGKARFQDEILAVLGRVSMDLVTLDASSASDLREGDWVDLDFDLEQAASQTGISQYELLTGLGQRFERFWV